MSGIYTQITFSGNFIIMKYDASSIFRYFVLKYYEKFTRMAKYFIIFAKSGSIVLHKEILLYSTGYVFAQ